MTRPRRSPSAEERKRDPERTREKILDAAVVEFGEHGFAGARISAIAARAGVNQQLISYYFDGKEGLYRALQARWEIASADMNAPEMPMAQVVENFLRASIEQRSWTRLLAWQGLTGDDTVEHDAFFGAMVDDLRRRQRAGEIGRDLDPAYVQLVLFGAVMAPAVLPQVVRRLTGRTADSPEFLDEYGEQLAKIIGRLAE
jgi:TetR/AcrR family transcriptional regulator